MIKFKKSHKSRNEPQTWKKIIESQWVAIGRTNCMVGDIMKRLEIKRDRVREHSPDSANRRIDEKMIGRLKEFAKKRKEDLMKRVDALDREWDIEQMLELNASILALAGTAMSFFFGKKWLAVPAVIAGFLIQHAIQGWCPPLPIFRWLGIRTQKEIQKERYEMMKLLGAK